MLRHACCSFRRISMFVVIFLCLTPSAFAASKIKYTQGSYLEIDAVNMENTQEISLSSETDYDDVAFKNKPSGSGNGYGLSYKYAFSAKDALVYPFSRMFLAPGIFYEDAESTSQDYFGDRFTIGNRYGAKLDMGWDFDYGIATYAAFGYSSIKYDVSATNFDDFDLHESDPNQIVRRTSISGTSYAPFYGLGLAYSPFKHITLNLEYNYQKNIIDTAPESGSPTVVFLNKIINKSQIVKFGVAYHF